MRLRKLALAVGLAGALGAEMASALGLGEIKLLSTLNQPLEAEIKLLQASDLTRDEILINLASSEDFQRAGIDREFFLTDLKFSVDVDASGGPVIRVTTRKPVREPYLNFLLESQWPNGRILREYTLLMDLPLFGDDNVRPVQSASTRAVEPQTAAPRPPRQQAVAPQPPAQQDRQRQTRTASAQRGADVYGPVGSSDTLWEIALKTRPSRQYSVQQTMLAIQRLNPEAFINGNINLLRKGQVLRIPSGTDIENVSERQAVSEVAFQNGQWSGDASATPKGAQLDGSKSRPASAPVDSGVSGRLKVANAESTQSLQAGRAAGEIGGDVESLQNELAISMEQLDKSSRENTELQSRVEELEDQIQTMERLLDVSSQELRALQLNSQNKAVDAVEASQADQALATAQADGDTESLSLSESQAESEAGIESASGMDTVGSPELSEAVEPVVAEQPQVVKRADPTKVVRSAKPKEKSFMDIVMDNILYIGGGLAAILAGAFLLMRRRKDDEDDSFAMALEQEDDTQYLQDNDDEPFIADEPEQDVPHDQYDAALESFDEVSSEADVFDLDDSIPTESQTGDAVGEADIYIAYGKFDQAEEMLLKSLESNDQDTAARLKLMEVYVETQALDKFDYQYGQVQALGDAPAMSRADDLREQFADAPAYIAMDEQPVAEPQGESEVEFDLGDDSLSADAELGEDFSLSFESDLTAGDSSEASDVDSAGLLDDEEFTLDLDDELASDELSLDLDLNLDGDDEAMDFDLDLNLDDVPASTDEGLADEGLADLGLSLDLEDSSISNAGDDLEFDLDLDEPSAGASEGDLSLDLDDDFSLDFEEATDSESSLDVSAPLESSVSTDNSDAGFDVSEALTASDSPEAELSLDLNDDDALGELTFESADDDGFDLDELDLDAGELASIDAELDALDIESPAVLEEPLPELNVAPSDGELDDFDVGDIDLSKLDEEIDDLSSPLGEGALASLDDELEADFASFDEPSADAPEVLTLEDELRTDIADDDLELSLGDLDDVPTLDSVDVESAADAEPEVIVEAEPLAAEETEFDLAADLGLDADDFDVEQESSEDDVFTAALSDLPTPEDVMAGDEMTDEDLDAELDFLADTDEAATKLDLARAYIDMGDQDGAKDILDEVVHEGNDQQKQEAQELLTRMS